MDLGKLADEIHGVEEEVAEARRLKFRWKLELQNSIVNCRFEMQVKYILTLIIR